MTPQLATDEAVLYTTEGHISCLLFLGKANINTQHRNCKMSGQQTGGYRDSTLAMAGSWGSAQAKEGQTEAQRDMIHWCGSRRLLSLHRSGWLIIV